ncbi:MAG: hypothetical protein WCG27_08890, partial [Pseudomonadota bacterium]
MQLNLIPVAVPKDLFAIYRPQIEEKFKKTFWDNLSRKERKSIEELIESSLHELGIHQYTAGDTQWLKAWALNVGQLFYLKTFIIEDKYREILAHGHRHLQLDSGGQMEQTALELKAEEFQHSLEYLAMENGISWNY